MDGSYDFIVIGSGQGGVPFARAAAEAGKRTALIERAAIGGTCINYGCTPTKTLVHIAKVAQTVRRAGEYGVLSGPPTMDMPKARELKRQIVADFSNGSREQLEKTENLDLIFGHATFTGPKRMRVGERTIEGGAVVIDTGARPFIPDIEGLASARYLDNRTIMELDHVPPSLIVLGGGYIGLEFGQMFARFGSRVTIVEQGSRFLPREDADVADEILEFLRTEGVDVRLGDPVKRVRRSGGVEAELASGMFVKGDEILVATGRRPNTDDLGVEAAGIALDGRGFIPVDSRLKTSAEGVYAIGDVNGGPAFTHISYDDFRILKTNLLDDGDRTTEGRLVPYTMFTDPELGRIGLSEDEAKRKGIDYRLCKLPMDYVARALEMNETRGFVKALVSKETDLILGAAALGIWGGEIMSMIEIAMMGGLTAKDLANATFAHPNLSELLNNLFG
ncbi:MAG TPA: mercuric reductase [Fimbriimonadaceae bacterium]|nr:mercuric reductase [Fimbriimonadaceae bacterium]